jgi:phosphoglycolate phosphatase
MLELARRLEAETGMTLRDRLLEVVGFDPLSGRISPNGHLAVTPTADFHAVILQELYAAGLSPAMAKSALTAAWHLPDGRNLSRPLTDLATLFNTLHACGSKVAVATSDDRKTTEAAFTKWGLTTLIDAIACADDGLPMKPEPDMALSICKACDVSPVKTVVVGDNWGDLQMGRAAGVGLNIGVLSGLGVKKNLAPFADLVLSSVHELMN